MHTSIPAVIRETIRETDRTVALQDCLHSWDGNIDLDVVVGGIGDRLRAMGTPVDNVKLKRDDLNMVTISTTEFTFTCRRNSFGGYSMGSIEWTGEDGIKYAIFAMSPRLNRLFTESELMRICEWATNHFYHQ